MKFFSETFTRSASSWRGYREAESTTTEDSGKSHSLLVLLDLVWANYGPGAICAQLSFLIWPVELTVIIIILSIVNNSKS